MSCEAIITLTESDLLPFLEFEWEEMIITGYDIKLHVRLQDGTKFTRTAVIDEVGDGANVSAEWHFEWQAGDLVRGVHEAEVEVFDDLDRNETWKGIVLDISEDIA